MQPKIISAQHTYTHTHARTHARAHTRTHTCKQVRTHIAFNAVAPGTTLCKYKSACKKTCTRIHLPVHTQRTLHHAPITPTDTHTYTHTRSPSKAAAAAKAAAAGEEGVSLPPKKGKDAPSQKGEPSQVSLHSLVDF